MASEASQKLKEIEEFQFKTSSTGKFTKSWSDELMLTLNKQFSGLNSNIRVLVETVGALESSLIAKVNKATIDAGNALTKAEENATSINELRTQMNELSNECKTLRHENYELKRQCDSVESYTRRDNLIFYGIKENNDESSTACELAVRDFMKTSLGITHVDDIRFVRCHRLKATRSDNIRPIIVRFREFHEREMVWKKLRVLPKKSKFYLSEDFPKSVIHNRKKLLPIFMHARTKHNKRDVSLKKDTLNICGNMYTVKNISSLKDDLNPMRFSRKSNDESLVFGGSLSEFEPLSNWGKTPVKYKDITFPSLEHGYM